MSEEVFFSPYCIWIEHTYTAIPDMKRWIFQITVFCLVFKRMSDFYRTRRSAHFVTHIPTIFITEEKKQKQNECKNRSLIENFQTSKQTKKCVENFVFVSNLFKSHDYYVNIYSLKGGL